MANLFLHCVNLSISAGWLVLAVLVLRLMLKKAPHWIHVLLWGVVGLRLILPFSLESAWSLVPSSQTIPTKVLSGPSFDINTGFAVVDQPINQYLGSHYFEGVSVPVQQGLHTMTQLSMIWVVGVVFLLLYGLFGYLRLRWRVSTAVQMQPHVYQSEWIDTPFVLGILRPNIYLPFQIKGENLTYVLAHEQAHLQRKDHWWKLLGFLLLCVYWFHPLMWVAYALLCRDLELACDEKVIRPLPSAQRADYSQALLACSTHSNFPLSYPPGLWRGRSERAGQTHSQLQETHLLVCDCSLSCLCGIGRRLSDRSQIQLPWFPSRTASHLPGRRSQGCLHRPRAALPKSVLL